MRIDTSTTVYCDHDQIVSVNGKIKTTTCGCREAECCSGCGKEDCTGCPCGTYRTIKNDTLKK